MPIALRTLLFLLIAIAGAMLTPQPASAQLQGGCWHCDTEGTYWDPDSAPMPPCFQTNSAIFGAERCEEDANAWGCWLWGEGSCSACLGCDGWTYSGERIDCETGSSALSDAMHVDPSSGSRMVYEESLPLHDGTITSAIG